jgi:hypothetical protein
MRLAENITKDVSGVVTFYHKNVFHKHLTMSPNPARQHMPVSFTLISLLYPCEASLWQRWDKERFYMNNESLRSFMLYNYYDLEGTVSHE